MQPEKLSITLPAEMARVIRGEVESGAYSSDSEVIRDALRLWLRARQERESVSRHFAARLAEAGQKRTL